jgi:hypothetical protein
MRARKAGVRRAESLAKQRPESWRRGSRGAGGEASSPASAAVRADTAFMASAGGCQVLQAGPVKRILSLNRSKESPMAPRVLRVPRVLRGPRVPRAPLFPWAPQAPRALRAPRSPPLPWVPQAPRSPPLPWVPLAPRGLRAPRAPLHLKPSGASPCGSAAGPFPGRPRPERTLTSFRVVFYTGLFAESRFARPGNGAAPAPTGIPLPRRRPFRDPGRRSFFFPTTLRRHRGPSGVPFPGRGFPKSPSRPLFPPSGPSVRRTFPAEPVSAPVSSFKPG